MAKAGRDLWRSSGLIPLVKQGLLELVYQDHRAACAHCSITPIVEKLFPDAQREPPVFLFVPTASCPVNVCH